MRCNQEHEFAFRIDVDLATEESPDDGEVTQQWDLLAVPRNRFTDESANGHGVPVFRNHRSGDAGGVDGVNRELSDRSVLSGNRNGGAIRANGRVVLIDDHRHGSISIDLGD